MAFSTGFVAGSNSSSQLFRIGGIPLDGFEAAEQLHLAHKQQLAIQHYVGGGRSIQSFGIQPEPVRWKGTFVPQESFRNAQDGSIHPHQYDPIARMIQLQLLHDKGEPIELIFGRLFWSVVISHLEITMMNVNRVEYVIECEVLADETVDDSYDLRGNQLAGVGGTDQLTLILRLMSLNRSIFEDIQEKEIFLFLTLTTIAAIKSGQISLAGLSVLVAANATLAEIGVEIGLINLANDLTRAAIIIKAVAGSLS